MKCPICDNVLKIEETAGSHGVEESSVKCKDEHHFYSDQFSYGNTEIIIGSVMFQSHHLDSERERALQTAQMNAVIELERKEYQFLLAGEDKP